MPLPYLLQVHSHPVRVPRTTWSQWYTEEHIRDMVHFGAAKTAAFYQATTEVLRSVGINDSAASLSLARVPSATAPDGNDFKSFLALYQSNRKHCLDHEEYKDHVRLTSELWDAASSSHDVGSFQPADLEVVEVVGGSRESEDRAASHIIHCKIVGQDAEAWLQTKHYEAASQQSPGYRRTVVLRPVKVKQTYSETNGGIEGTLSQVSNGVANGDMAGTEPEMKFGMEPCVILLHEYDGHDGPKLEQLKEATEAINGSDGFSFSLRAYELVESEGFGGNARRPERLRDTDDVR